MSVAAAGATSESHVRKPRQGRRASILPQISSVPSLLLHPPNTVSVPLKAVTKNHDGFISDIMSSVRVIGKREGDIVVVRIVVEQVFS